MVLPAAPLLSVVVTVVEGGAALPRFLRALLSQRDAPPLEILVPIDDSVSELLALQPDFPAVRFLDLGPLVTSGPRESARVQHELYDRRRTAALRAATGSIVAILEDRGIPRPDWARTVVRLHHQPWAVIGGAIEPASSSRLADWALHVCDFSRYSLPLTAGPSPWVSDVNVTYKRRALEATRSTWADRFHEPVVHWELLRQGEVLYLSPELIVDHYRAPRPLAQLVVERFQWGRLFGYIRARHSSRAQRAGQVLVSPLVPFLLLSRHARVQFRRGDARRLVKAVPLLLGFLAAWAAGEAVGAFTREP